ncbi:hypothetical protein PUMCH_004575 [Australozyma saopauloensis]|uniref:Copper-fist domain-containing protein n=1 Tax=Australozyma saopauloensis TaxID=291208 RepID=A0AAX4HFF8_9ASCO|nr:hypothetical protein PUMCH_004575 [[Candida] saopauloensis]
MVLLNGVKYACERCIRGHRVSSCTHTDKPLTMIKPKGRPASQCPHCREQRKLKNTHSSCNCGKKGKAPGTHLASCLCHKNSHCTCPGKDKKSQTKKRTDASPSASAEPVSVAPSSVTSVASTTTPPNGHFSSAPPPNGTYSGVSVTPQAATSNSGPDFLYDDMSAHLESEQGLLDYFIKLEDLDGAKIVPGIPGITDELRANLSLDSVPLLQEGRAGPAAPFANMNFMTNSPSDAELDAMENMFPLFPLVGSTSFDDDKSLPLLPIPDRPFDSLPHETTHKKTLDTKPHYPIYPPRLQLLHGITYHNQHHTQSHNHSQPHSQGQHQNLSQPPTQSHIQSQNQVQNQAHNQGPSQNHNASGLGLVSLAPAPSQAPAPATAPAFNVNSRVNLQLHISTLGSYNGHHNGGPGTPISTQHPHPLKPSSSFTIGYNLNPKLRRPESVLSLASTSSNTSKQNLFETPQMNQHTFLKTPSSAAFPPFLLSGNNSTDEFNFPSYNSLSAVLNDSNLMMFLSDEDSGSHNTSFRGNGIYGNGMVAVPSNVDSAVPPPRALLLRRTSSLSRSHSQAHSNMVSKDHPQHLHLPQLKTSIYHDSSPRLAPVRTPASASERTFYKPPSIGSFVPEEDEEFGLSMGNDNGLQPDSYISDSQRSNFDSDSMPLELQDLKSIPMYQDLFEGMDKHV